jgi:hypothetical protein
MKLARGTLSRLLVVWTVLALGLPLPATAQQPLSVTLIYLVSPTSPGNAASITVRTAPSASCTISVVYKSGPSQARGLVPKTAGKDGVVGWAWVVGTRATPGMWPITVSCSAGGNQGTLWTAFEVL